MQSIPEFSSPFLQARSPSLLSISAEAERYADRVRTLASDAPASTRSAARGLSQAIDATAAAQKALAQACADAAKLIADPTRARKFKIDGATKGIQTAQREAESALDAAMSAAATARKTLERALMPQAPDQNSPMVAFHAHQLADLIKARAAGHPERLAQLVGELMAQALAADDQTTVWLLSSQMWSVYGLVGASPDTAAAIRQSIANSFSALQGSGPTAEGADLLVELGDGGAFTRWAQMAKYWIGRTAGPALESITNLANNGQIQNWG